MNMDDDQDDCNPHLALMLPEIIGRIATFLPKSDLLTCTLVSTSWEPEIRKRLLTLTHRTLTEDNIASSQEIITIRKNCPRSIRLFESKKLLAVNFCADFISENGRKIKTLQADLILPSATWPQYLASLSNSFPNMTSLVLNVIPCDDNEPVSEPQFLADLYSFSKVNHLVISSGKYFYSIRQRDEIFAALSSMIPQFVPLFPNLATLSVVDVGDSVVQNCIDAFPKLTRFKFVSTNLIVPLRQTVLHLTRLEIGHYYRNTPSFSALLKLTSGTLEHLTFSKLPNVRPVFNQRVAAQNVLNLPILPKLRVFELVQNQCTESGTCRNANVTPDIVLKFEGCGASTRKRVDYGVHLPVLETIKISRAGLSQFDNVADRLTDQKYFEASVSFLYDFFLHESNSLGESVKQLDVPFPPGDKFRLVKIEECHCGRRVNSCQCFELKYSSEFWDRVVAVFPNLVKYEAIGLAWKRARAAKIKQWVELGEELGFVKEITREDAGRRVDLDLGDEIYLEVADSVKK